MASISSLSSASIGDSVTAQLRLQQAQRNAEQAEANARAMQAQAREARQVASEAAQTARSVSSQADQAQANASEARLDLAIIKSGSQVQTQMTDAVTVVAKNLTAPPAVATTQTPAQPVVNTQGQVTGVVINTTA